MSWDQMFLILLLLCSVIGLLHIMYYLGRIFGWAVSKLFKSGRKEVFEYMEVQNETGGYTVREKGI